MKEDLRTLPIKFGLNRVTNCRGIADTKFPVAYGSGGWWVGGSGGVVCRVIFMLSLVEFGYWQFYS